MHGTLFNNLTLANGSLLRLLAKHCPSYCLDYSKTVDGHYFMNHCSFCGAKLGDFFMHSEPDGAFFPTREESAREIKLHHFKTRLLVVASGGESSLDPLELCADLGCLD